MGSNEKDNIIKPALKRSRYAALLTAGMLTTAVLTLLSTPRHAATGRVMAATIKDGRILLPIEVLGADGTTKTCTFNLPRSVDNGQLRMEVNALDYDGKGSVKLNDGPWTALSNSTVDVDEPGKSYGGIGGGYATLWIDVPVNASLPAGANQVAFRFNKTDGVSSGYRILRFNIVDANGHDVVPASAFVDDDPDTWTAPLTTSTQIEAGRKLWSSAVLTENDLAGAGHIQAACADCHAVDGRDLKYFNYSNESIEARSVFHGLTDLQGKQIASYIRSLPYPNPGRPWNPVYQPGVGLDAKSAANWSAGAGLASVMPHDVDTARYLVDDPKSTAPDGNLNLRQLPISLQLLDWNEWLPHVHPKDAWGADFTSSRVFQDYQAVDGNKMSHLSEAIRNDRADRGALKTAFSMWEAEGHDFLKPRSESPDVSWTPEYAQKCYSTALWQRVKMWELLQAYNLEDNPSDPSGETRSWLSGGLFQTSPARLKIPCSDDALTGSKVKYEYLNNAWYELQMITNSGGRAHKGNDPIDWPYLRGRVKDLYVASHSPQAMRLAAYLIKGIQEGSNGIGPEERFTGWNPMNLADISTLVSPSFEGAWGDTPHEVRAEVLDDICSAWLSKVTQYPPERYYAAGYAKPTEMPGRNINGGPWVDRVYGMLPLLRANGVNSDIVDRMAAWAAKVWPTAGSPVI